MEAPSGRTSRRTRVLLAGDEPVARGVLRTACEASDDLVVAAECDASGAPEATRRAAPDLVVVEPFDPSDADGIVDGVRSARGAARIVLVADAPDAASALRWMRMPIDGLVPPTCSVAAIVGAVRTVAEGGRVVDARPRALAVAQLGRELRAMRAAETAPLTITELRLLRLLADGLTVRQAASRMHVSPRTVESHVTNLYRKLGVRSRLQALARASAAGHVDLGPTTNPRGEVAGTGAR